VDPVGHQRDQPLARVERPGAREGGANLRRPLLGDLPGRDEGGERRREVARPGEPGELVGGARIDRPEE
jgi:hypothetical protein